MSIRGTIAIVRPGNVLVIALGVGVGAALASDSDWADGLGAEIWLAAAAACLVGAGGNAANDIFDAAADRVNRPSRPLPSGAISQQAAAVIAVGTSVLGLVLASLLSAGHFLIAGATALLLLLYNAALKGVALVGNVVVSAAVALSLLFGALSGGIGTSVIVGAGFAFLTTLSREVIKDLQDVAGDQSVGARTIPVLLGTRVSSAVAVASIAVTVLLIPAPYVLLDFPGLYLVAILPAAMTLLLAMSEMAVWRDDSRPRCARASNLMKASMVMGLLSLLATIIPE